MINDRLLSQAVDIIKSSKEIVVFTGAGLIFINRDNTIMDDLADVFLKGNGGEILTELIRLLR